MVRRDVYRLAEKLSGDTGFEAWELYRWLMKVGQAKGINPKRLEYTTGDKIIFVKGERDEYCYEKYTAPLPRHPEWRGPDYHDLIMARQEKIWED